MTHPSSATISFVLFPPFHFYLSLHTSPSICESSISSFHHVPETLGDFAMAETFLRSTGESIRIARLPIEVAHASELPRLFPIP
jgi:hypothetical protein